MQLIGTNVLPVPIGQGQNGTKTDLPAKLGLKYCPGMDLLVVFPQLVLSEQVLSTLNSQNNKSEDYDIDGDHELLVEVYRLNNQKVFTVGIDSQGSTIGICDVAWRQDGVILAIAASNGTIRLVNSFSGKIVHIFQSYVPSVKVTDAASLSQTSTSTSTSISTPATIDATPVSHGRRSVPNSIQYSTHFFNPQALNGYLRSANEGRKVVLDDLLGFNVNLEQLLNTKTGLPQELAMIDVEQFLPKLSILPANGMGEDDIFSTRTSVDAMFHPIRQSTQTMITDLVTIAYCDSQVHVRVFDSFEIGNIDLDHALDKPVGCKLGSIKGITTHALIEKVYLIVGEQTSSTRLWKAKTSSNARDIGKTLHLLSLDLRFLPQSNLTLPTLATKATQLHNLIRYLQQVELHIAREVKSAFDLPARFIRLLDEDLKEQDGTGSTFETAAHHTLLTGDVDEKFKEWLVDILGDRGVKRWDKAVSDCLDLVRRLLNEAWNPAVERAGIVISRLVGLAAADTAFGIKMKIFDNLRDAINVMAVLGEDLLRDTMTEIAGFNAFMRWLKKEVEMAGLEDSSEKLDEIREGSEHADVRKVVDYITQSLRSPSVKIYVHEGTQHTRIGEDNTQMYERFKQGRQRSQYIDDIAPSFRFLTTQVMKECGLLFQQVAIKLREKVLVEHVCRLPDGLDEEMLDCRILHGQDLPILHVVGKKITHEGELWQMRIPLEAKKVLNNLTAKQIAIKDIKAIKDVKFADDEEVLILAETTRDISIFGHRFCSDEVQTIRHSFGRGKDEFIKAGLRPWRLEVNGRKGRRTVTVLDEQGRGFGVFDLDSSASVVDDDNTMGE